VLVLGHAGFVLPFFKGGNMSKKWKVSFLVEDNLGEIEEDIAPMTKEEVKEMIIRGMDLWAGVRMLSDIIVEEQKEER